MDKMAAAEDKFCDKMDSFIEAIMEEEDCSYWDAVDIAKDDQDEYWRVLKEEYGVEE